MKATPTDSTRREFVLHRLFRLGIWIKGLDGLIELAGGLLLLITSNIALNQIVNALTRHELSEDPRDWLALTLRHAAAQLSVNTRLFGSLYLIVHGAVKIGLMIAVLRGKTWAYPVAIALLSVLIGYQLYRISLHASLSLSLLTLLDLIVVALIWHEYRSAHPVRSRHDPPGP